LSIRVLPSKVQEQTFALLGAVPMRLDLTEAITAITAGTIDAQENPLSNTVTYERAQIPPLPTSPSHFYISRPISCTAPVFDGWPQDLQSPCARPSTTHPVSARCS